MYPRMQEFREKNKIKLPVIVGNLTNFVKNTLFLPDAVKTACHLEVSTLFHILLTYRD